jgi:hypothetical protein
MDFIKKYDVYGKPVTFYYNTSTVHKTCFGGILSLLSFSLMMTITITSLINFLYQKPVINSNVVYFINKKFAKLEGMDIKGKLIIEKKDETEQLDDFVKYYRIVLHEKYYDEVELYHVGNLVKTDSNVYDFNVTMSISGVFKEKEFSTLKIMSCREIKKHRDIEWSNFLNESTCDLDYEKYFEKNYINENFLLSFDAPIYTVDRKGSLRRVEHQNELRFKVQNNKKIAYNMETKYIVVEDDTNIYYTSKDYDAYFVMKRPIQLSEETIEKDYSLEIGIKNQDNDQIILITLYKYKLLDFLAKLGGIMKIITFMKMTGKFWSSFFYETTLYNLLVNRKNIYLEQKKMLLDTSVYYNKNKLKKNDTPGSMASLDGERNINLITTLNQKSKKPKESYTSYCSWFLNRFCKLCYDNKDAKQKRTMLVDTLGLNNYLLHLDYIDRQIILEQQTGEIDNKIKEIIGKNENRNEMDNNDNTSIELKNDVKNNDFPFIEPQENNLKQALTANE